MEPVAKSINEQLGKLPVLRMFELDRWLQRAQVAL
jgi:hypothetical protein